jgi:hypothetical protein
MTFPLRLLLLLLLTASALRAQTLDYRYQSVFIYNFCQYIQWPQQDQFSEITIGVLGNGRVAQQMSQFFAGKSANAKKFVVKAFASPEELQYTQVLFVPVSNRNNLPEILQKVNSQATLLITEKEGWGRQGSGINFVISEEGKYQFELNQSALKKHNLKVATSISALAILL